MSERAGNQVARPGSSGRVGSRRWVTALIAGAALGLVTALGLLLVSDHYTLVFLAILLGMIAAVYVGFALNDGRESKVGWETAAAFAYGGLAVAGMAAREPYLLGIGYIGHALWDAIHPGGLDTKMPWWYVPMCIGFDLPVGVYILVRFA